MLTELSLACILVWVAVVLTQIKKRGLLILLAWLLVGPFVSNLINFPRANPFILDAMPAKEGAYHARVALGAGGPASSDTAFATVRWRELFEPTRILFGTFLAIYALEGIIRRRTGSFSLDHTEVWMLMFSVLALVNGSFWANRPTFGVRVAIDAFVVPFLAYFTARRLIRTEDQLTKVLTTLVWTGAFLVVIGSIERIGASQILYRLHGPFDNRDSFYIVLMLIFFAVLAETIRSKFDAKELRLSKAVCHLLLVLCPLLIFLIWTRSCWLGFLLGMWTVATLGWAFIPRRQKLVFLGLSFFIPIGGVALIEFVSSKNQIQSGDSESVTERMSNPENLYGRLATYKVILNEAVAHPLLGIGLNNLRDVLVEKRDYFLGVRSYPWSHQSYLAILSELGLLGFMMYMGVVVSIVKMGFRLMRLDRWRGIAVVAVMIGYLVPPMFDATLYQTNCSNLYVYAYVGSLAGWLGNWHSMGSGQHLRSNLP